MSITKRRFKSIQLSVLIFVEHLVVECGEWMFPAAVFHCAPQCALLRAAQALALIRGRDFVTPDDIKALAKPVLGHRIVLGGMYGRTSKPEDVIAEVLGAVETPTEPCERA